MISDILGIRFGKHSNAEESFRYKLFAVVIITVSLSAAFSCFVYSDIIFQDTWIGVLVSITLGAIVFNIYRMLVVTSLESNHSVLSKVYNDPKSLILDYERRLKPVPDTTAGIESLVRDIMYEARADISEDQSRISHDRVTILVKLVITIFLGFCFATGLEILIFKDQLNELIHQVNVIYSSQVDSWIFNSTEMESSNRIVNSTSLLLVVNLLIDSLGNVKYLIDSIVIFIFCVPILLVYRSRLVTEGLIVEELALEEIEITITHTLKSIAFCDDFLVRNFNKESVAIS